MWFEFSEIRVSPIVDVLIVATLLWVGLSWLKSTRARLELPAVVERLRAGLPILGEVNPYDDSELGDRRLEVEGNLGDLGYVGN